MSSEVAPGIVQAKNIIAYDLESNPVVDTGAPLYWERFIHGEIYKARPDVHAVVHSHSLPLILFSTVDAAFRPVFHMAAFLHVGIPTFDIHEVAGATDLMVRTPELGVALAGSLADKPMVLMRGHGATIVGASIKQAVWRAIYAMQNAQLQSDGTRFAKQTFLYADEAAVAAANITALDRPWSFWRNRALQNTDDLDA
jgi:HCOMODA/2-hydroxy-3-carboxy-muconic semialdehyde decarboxylase